VSISTVQQALFSFALDQGVDDGNFSDYNAQIRLPHMLIKNNQKRVFY